LSPQYPAGISGKAQLRDSTGISREIKNLTQSGRQDLNLRPLGPECGKPVFAEGGIPMQRSATIQELGPADLQASAENGAAFRNFAAPLLQEFGQVLSVRQVATVLRLSRASIYKLCASGELAHVRILNAIRIPSWELAGLLSGNAPMRLFPRSKQP
jgi:excisionase family DNA binding protein